MSRHYPKNFVRAVVVLGVVLLSAVSCRAQEVVPTMNLWVTLLDHHLLSPDTVVGAGPAIVFHEITYPESAVRDRLQGLVFVQMRVMADSTIRELKATIPDPKNTVLLHAVEEGLKESRFVAGNVHGTPRDMRIELQMRFTLEREEIELTGFSAATHPRYDPAQLSRLIQYPRRALEDNVEGDVTVDVKVDAEGNALNVLVRSATDPVFIEEGVKAARRLQFSPGTQGGQPMTMWTTISIKFRLED